VFVDTCVTGLLPELNGGTATAKDNPFSEYAEAGSEVKKTLIEGQK
jgi:hypothetical protein